MKIWLSFIDSIPLNIGTDAWRAMRCALWSMVPMFWNTFITVKPTTIHSPHRQPQSENEWNHTINHHRSICDIKDRDTSNHQSKMRVNVSSYHSNLPLLLQHHKVHRGHGSYRRFQPQSCSQCTCTEPGSTTGWRLRSLNSPSKSVWWSQPFRLWGIGWPLREK